MSQSVLYSLFEQFVNVSLGFAISILFLYLVVNPLFALSLTIIASIEVSLIMLMVSLIRGLLLRRLFIRLSDVQTIKASIVEKTLDVSIGFIIALVVWSFIVMPAYDTGTTFIIDTIINLMFFVVNLVRSVFVRRVFENNYQKHNLIGTR